MFRIRRRQFLTLLGGAAAWPLAARAQQPATPLIGVIAAGTPSTHGQWIAGFVQRLRELGWIENRTVAIEIRWAEGRNERYTEIAAEFVRREVDVILTSGPGVPAAKQATSTGPCTARACFFAKTKALSAKNNGKPMARSTAKRSLGRTNQSDAGVFTAEIGFTESKNYVFKVMSNYRAYRQLYDSNLNRR